MEEDQAQFDKDDFTGLDGQNGENFDQQENAEQTVEDGGDQAMETGADAEEDGSEDERKLFVGGLSWETTTKDLREYFEKHGEVTSCTIKTDVESRQSRGFGFVVFKTQDALKEALKIKEHKLHGRTIDPKQANPRKGITKIFVGRLDPGVPEEDVKTYFSTFGPIAKIDLPFDKVKEQRRAFCFVEFENDAAVKKILEQATHKLGGQEVDVKKALPNNAQQGPGGPGGRGGRGRGGFGGGPGFGGRGGRGGRGGWNQGGNWNQGGYGGYQQGGYGGYGGGYGQGGYGGGYGGYGGNDYYGYGGYGQGGWEGYGQGYGSGYGGYEGNSSYGKTQKRGGHAGGYHPYNR